MATGLCHPELALLRDRRVSLIAVEMLRFAQHDMILLDTLVWESRTIVVEFVRDHHISEAWSNPWSLVFVPTVSTVC